MRGFYVKNKVARISWWYRNRHQIEFIVVAAWVAGVIWGAVAW